MLTDLWTNIRQERVPTRVLEGKKCRPGRHRDVTIKGARGLLCYLHTFKEWPHTKDTMEKIRARKAPEDMARFNESLNSLFFYRDFTVSFGHWWINFKRKARFHGVWAPSIKCPGDQDPESVYAGYVMLFYEAGLLPYDPSPIWLLNIWLIVTITIIHHTHHTQEMKYIESTNKHNVYKCIYRIVPH